MARMLSQWDERFAAPALAYGEEPNPFIAEVAGRIPTGEVLCLAEGQGRHAVFLAKAGHAVTAMDQSSVGLGRARELADKHGVRITTQQGDLADFVIEPGRWSGIVSVFAHVPAELRRDVHRRVVAGLAAGGVFAFVAYSQRQLQFGTGGPKDVSLLPTLEQLREELAGLTLEVAEERERVLAEGTLHIGRSSLIEVLARKARA